MRNWGRGNDAESTRGARVDRESPLPGVIDTIGFGYAALFLRPLVILPIVLLDFWILLGPKVTLAPLTVWLAGAARDRGGSWDEIAIELERLEAVNVADVTTLGVPLLRTPAIAPTFGSERLEAIDRLGTWTSLPVWLVAVLLVALLVAGVVVAALYRLLLSSAAVPGRTTADSLRPPLVGRTAIRIVGWAAALLGLAVLVAMPVLTATVVGAIAGVGSVTLLWLLLLIPATWAWVHFFFSVHALVVDDSGPMLALRSSYQVVQRHFWQSIRFMAASLLITTGLSFALRELAASLPGALLAVLLNAIIASGMLVAAMLFYRDRASRLGSVAHVPER